MLGLGYLDLYHEIQIRGEQVGTVYIRADTHRMFKDLGLYLAATGAALLVACLSFGTYEFLSARKALLENARGLAEIVGQNCEAALLFDDTNAAQETLDSLRSEAVVAAAVYREDSVLWGGKTWGIVAAEQLHGKALSYNNFLDADGAWRASLDFAEPTGRARPRLWDFGVQAFPVNPGPEGVHIGRRSGDGCRS